MSNQIKITIRRYEKSDFDQITDIGKALPEWFTENGIAKMQIDIRYHKVFVAILDSKIVGFLSFFTCEGEGKVGWMGVIPELHRNGIGRSLIDNLVSELREIGVKTLKVCTLGDSVDYEPYAKTRAFYKAVGFKGYQRIETGDPECPEQLILKMDIQEIWRT